MSARAAPASRDAFLPRFIALTILAGATIGMGNVVTTLFALRLGATTVEVGFISGAATIGMMLVTLPAGTLIARFGARRVYLLASLNCAAIYAFVPWLGSWPALAVARGLVGASVPFRTVSMSSSFLQRVREIGIDKAGWYRASQSTGMAVIGPWLGAALTGSGSFVLSYGCLSALFLGMATWSQRFLPGEQNPVNPEAAHSGSGTRLLELLRDRWVAESCLTELVSSATTSLFSSFVIVLAVRNLGWPTESGVALVTAQGLATIAALFALGPLLRRRTLALSYVLSIALASAALLLIGLGRTLPVLMLGAIALAAAAALIHLVNQSRLAQSPLSKSRLASLVTFSGQAGSLLGSVAGGLLSAAIGLQSVFLLWLLPLWLVAIACFLLFHFPREVRS